MRFTRDGRLVYHCAKMKNSLIYYSNSDLRHATQRGPGTGETAWPGAFEVSLAPKEELEFAPGVFAAADDKEREKWLAEYQKLQVLAEAEEEAEEVQSPAP